MEDIEIVEEKEITFNFTQFYLIYNITNDYWYIEYLEEDDDDFMELGSIHDIVGKNIKGHTLTEEDVKKFLKVIELELE